MKEDGKCFNKDQKVNSLAHLRDTARRERSGIEINEGNLEFHPLPEFMEQVIQNGGRILIDMGGNIFILGWHDKNNE